MSLLQVKSQLRRDSATWKILPNCHSFCICKRLLLPVKSSLTLHQTQVLYTYALVCSSIPTIDLPLKYRMAHRRPHWWCQLKLMYSVFYISLDAFHCYSSRFDAFIPTFSPQDQFVFLLGVPQWAPLSLRFLLNFEIDVLLNRYSLFWSYKMETSLWDCSLLCLALGENVPNTIVDKCNAVEHLLLDAQRLGAISSWSDLQCWWKRDILSNYVDCRDGCLSSRCQPAITAAAKYLVKLI